MRRIVSRLRINNSISTDWSLHAGEVEQRRRQYGANDIVGIKSAPWFALLQNTLTDPMIWFLIATSILFAILKNNFEAVILIMAIIPLIAMDAFLHWRTQTSTESLNSRLAQKAVVIRDGVKTTIPAWEIVCGDLVEVSAGSIFPADGLIIGGQHIQVEESSLTGEAIPVSKKILSVFPGEGDEVAIDASYWGFAGTKVLTGHALVRIVYTGKDALYGEIVTSALQTSKSRTPLQKAIGRLVFALIVAASVMCVILALVRYYQGFGIVDAILSAATLAVAALPDEFPVVFTFFLGVGVYRLARKKALVRRAASIENLGRITYICSDKTGTITEGRLQLAKIVPMAHVDKDRLLQISVHAARAESYDLLDAAIIAAVVKKNMVTEPRIHSYPFTEDRKRETAIVAQEGQWWIVTKGAPEVILAISDLSLQEKIYWQQQVADLAALSYKVIACADKTMQPSSDMQEPIEGYQFKGLIAFTDPVRAGVVEAIQSCSRSHIHVLMITGDHPATAHAIAKEIGLGQGTPTVILAEALPLYLAQNGPESIRQIDVIARAIPLQKYAAVKVLQEQGEIVAVTGDGVNDVPALKVGDIGIAMGERGTQSAREVSDIVLLDDNFESIVHAIDEGKRLFRNLKLCFKYLLMIHFPFVITAALIPLFGYPLLYYPIQIVFIELIIHPTALLVFQDLPMPQRIPIAQQTESYRFFSRIDILNILLVGLLTTSFITFAFIYTSEYGQGIAYARGMTLAMLSFISVAITLRISGFQDSTAQALALIVIGVTVIFLQIPSISYLFGFEPLQLSSWGLIVAAGFLTWVFVSDGCASIHPKL